MNWKELYDIVRTAEEVFAYRRDGRATKIPREMLLGAARSKINDEANAKRVLDAIMSPERTDYIDMDVVDGFVNPVRSPINWSYFANDGR